MNTVSNAFPVAAVIRNLLGWGIKYLSCGMLTFVLLMCFGALVFAYVALWGSDISWLAPIFKFLPQDMAKSGTHELHTDDISGFLTRFWLGLSLVLTALSAVWRLVKRVRSGAPLAIVPVSMAEGLNLNPAAQRVRIHAGRRFLLGLGVVSAIFACAFIAIPHARMAAGSSHADMVPVFIVLYVFALVMTAAYIGLGIAADMILDG
ncbi:MAG TPA: hypothetical protein VFH71_11765 [Rhodanobacteraceae bacterium]|nr:hypothetical protein [Rhodanobacteraceae bacterium]